MSKRAYISRYLLIIKKIKAKPYTTSEELQHYIEKQMDHLQMQDDTLNMGISTRTLQRDIRDIKNLFGVDIEYSKTSKGYFINQSEMENMNFERMMEAFDLFNSLNIQLRLRFTNDLVMELLSYGDNMKVLQPQSLINEIKSAQQKAYKQY
mgnify:CR=1 FL=1